MHRETKIIRASFEVTRYQGGNLMEHVRKLASERRTGALTLLFSQGTICALEWRDKGTYSESFGEPWNGNGSELRR